MKPEELYRELARAVVDMDADRVQALARDALARNLPADEAIVQGLAAGMKVVGEHFAQKRYFVPEVLLATQAMKAGLEILKPKLTRPPSHKGRVVLATVTGDIHDIGKNIVGVLLGADGFEVTDLGKDVPIAVIVDAAANCDILGLSALMTTTMTTMATVIAELGRRGLRDRVRVLVGGAPTSPAFCRQIGADGYGVDARAAVREANRLVLRPD